VVVTVDADLRALDHHARTSRVDAEAGVSGGSNQRRGRGGRDVSVRVPIGTVVWDVSGGGQVQLADLVSSGGSVVVAAGGEAGRGNVHFASSTNQAPRHTQPGRPGEVRDLRLRLKLLADVGLVGFPNAGKSTLIARVSAARPKIANYPFTTLTPNLGVVSLSDERSFVVADVPGLIEGAHEGHGLGDRFLGHLERTRVLVHLVDVSSFSGRDPVEDFDIIQRELTLFRDAEDRSAGLLFRRATSYSKTHRPRPGGTSGPCMVEENGIA
ncbi:MAG: Obg family GTPase CgtA, partial [Gemmatimonadales bacterium]